MGEGRQAVVWRTGGTVSEGDHSAPRRLGDGQLPNLQLCGDEAGDMIGPRPVKQTARDERRARAGVKERDKGLCVRCGWPGSNWDHRKNRSQGGRWDVSNGQTLCGSGTTCCHGWVTSHPALAMLQGFAVPSYARPELWPAWRHDVGWVLYFDSSIGGKWWQEISQATADLIMQGGEE